jgi:hypothetical protein
MFGEVAVSTAKKLADPFSIFISHFSFVIAGSYSCLAPIPTCGHWEVLKLLTPPRVAIAKAVTTAAALQHPRIV